MTSTTGHGVTVDTRPARHRQGPQTLGQYLRRGLVRAVAAGIPLLAAGAVAASVPNAEAVPFDVQPPTTPAAPAPGSPAALVEAHDCWTGDAPADMVGKMPGHVVTDNGYRGAAEVERALDQVFAGADHGLTVYGFCR